jgi:phosphatidylglycerophosphatase A
VKRFVRHVATLGPVGYSPVVPATMGSALTVVVGWFLPAPPLSWTLPLLLLGASAAVWVTGRAERDLGPDAHPIVVDEVIGQTVALLGVPHSLPAFFTAFALFRLCDIWKPLGARQAESLAGGLGVVGDDVIAGLTACGAFHLFVWGMRALGWMRP